VTRSTAAAAADDDPEVARGVIPGIDIDTPGGSWLLRKLESRNYQFIKAFWYRKGILPACLALNSKESEWIEVAMTRKPVEADPAASRQRAPLRRGERLRRRAAWMYYVEEMTQSAVAEALGIGRVTVVRMLAEARALGEVRIALGRGVADLAGLELALAKTLGLAEAIIAPLSAPDADPTAPIGAALGAVISELVADEMKIGLGWGLTLRKSLDHLSERAAKAVTVVSLVGGVTHVGSVNPAEFAWELARAYNADCYLIPAPALVDSGETRRALIERCGLAEVYAFARRLDAVVFGVGALDADSTVVRFGLVGEAERLRLREYGAVGEALCYVYSAEGRLIDHQINERVMSAPLEAVVAAPIRVMAGGGAAKLEALRGAARLLKPTTLVTDETTARMLIAAETGAKAR
jgi:DNA-binding transcriptional regulator LsrR (DeoR family)